MAKRIYYTTKAWIIRRAIVGFLKSQNDWMTISDDQMRIVLQWASRSRGVPFDFLFLFQNNASRDKRDRGSN